MAFDASGSIPPGAKIKVIGVGGGGSNAVNTMIRSGLEGVDFITVNTDMQALRFALPDTKIQIGKELTRGLGAGADPDVGRDAALEDRHALLETLAGADMVFITAGMGGGTGTGGASVIAQLAREQGALTVAVVTKPFNFEGKRRRRHAEMGIERLRESVDTLITIPNQRLLSIATPDLSMIDAFRMADEVLLNAVKGISDIINIPGTVNVDFADVKTVMSSMGMALMGIGRAVGENRAIEAAKRAISSPLLEDVNIEGATGILINITAGSSVSLMEVNEACSIIQDAAHEDANIIFGAVIDDSVGDEMRVTVIATGFPAEYDETISEPTEQIRKTTYAQPQRTLSAQPAVRPSFPKAPEIRKSGASAFEGWPKEPVVKNVMPSVQPKPQQPIQPIAKPLMPEPMMHEETQSSSVAEDLTRLTMSGIEDSRILEEPELDLPVQTQPVAQPKVEQTPAVFHQEEAHEKFEPIQKPAPQPQSLIGAKAAPTPIADLTEETLSPLSAFDANEDSFDAANFESGEEMELAQPAPMETLFEQAESGEISGDDFDQKIDEALELAERLKRSEDGQDDLDIPAFLREGMKDLSLD